MKSKNETVVDNSKPRLSLLNPKFVTGTIMAMMTGVDKYEEGDYLNGHKLSKYYDKVGRHILAFWGGEDDDPESKLNHLYHAAADLHIMIDILSRKPEHDDRPHKCKP